MDFVSPRLSSMYLFCMAMSCYFRFNPYSGTHMKVGY